MLIAASIVAACGASASPSSGSASPATPSSTATPPPGASQSTGEPDGGPSPSPSSAGDADAAAGLAGALEAAGAEVRLTGSFASDPIGGQGVGLCVDGQVVNVYVFPSVEEREAVSSAIDPDDPSNIGTSIVTWMGNPRFWQAERVIVLYLGGDPAIEAGLSSILGEPFARGRGAPAVGPDLNAC